MCSVFFAAVCGHRHCVRASGQELVEKHLFVMPLCQLDAVWHQNPTTKNLKALQANGRQVFEGRLRRHRDLHVATEPKAPHGLEEIAALVIQDNSLVPSAATASRMHSQKLIRKGIGPARTFPTTSLHVDDLGVVDAHPRQILEEDVDVKQEIRLVNRVHPDSSNGLLAMHPDLLVQLLPALVPIVAGLGPHGFPWRVRSSLTSNTFS